MTVRSLARRASGFTLIELLVVLLVIAILIAVAAPLFRSQTQKAHDSVTQQNLTVAYKEAVAYAVDGNGAPGHVQGHFDGFTPAVLTRAEPQLAASSGSCPTAAVGLPDNHIVIDTASGNNLVMCADPSVRVWTLQVTNGVLQPFPATPFTGPPSAPSDTVSVIPTNLTNVSSPSNAYDPNWSSDGNSIYFSYQPGNGDTIVSSPLSSVVPPYTPFVHEADPGNSQPVVRNGVMLFTSPRLGPDSLWTVPLNEDPLTQATRVAPADIDGWGGGYATLSYDGSKVAFLSGSNNLRLTDVGASTSTLLAVAAYGGDGVSISPDNSTVAFTSLSGNVDTVSASGGTPSVLVPTASSGVFGLTPQQASTPQYSPDGSKLIYGAEQGSEQYIVEVNASDGSLVKKYDLGAWFHSGCVPESFSFSPDGSRVLFDDCTTVSGGAEDIYLIHLS